VKRSGSKVSVACVLFAGAVLSGVLAVRAAESPSPGYHLLKKVVLGGEAGWDYFEVDSSITHRIFIPRDVFINVVDASGKDLGTIPTPHGSQGLAFAPEFKHGFTIGRGGWVTMFDPETLKVIKEVKPDKERNPDYLVYDPASKRLFTFNGREAGATAIDAQTGETVGFIDLGGRPEAGQADGLGHIYVAIIDKNQIAAFDSKQLKLLDSWSILPCELPHGLAIDAKHKRLFAGCRNGMTGVLDYTTGKMVATIPTGKLTDANRYDPAAGLVFTAGGDGTLTVAHQDTPDKYTVVQAIQTTLFNRTMALDTKTHNIFTVAATSPQVKTKEEAIDFFDAVPRRGALKYDPGSFSLFIFGR
jgi:DNA-binding beta-propeller fold protein YncE